MEPLEDSYCIYILTNKHHTVLYTGVTSDLYVRVLEHREKVYPGFTAKYNVHKLVYYDQFGESRLGGFMGPAIQGIVGWVG